MAKVVSSGIMVFFVTVQRQIISLCGQSFIYLITNEPASAKTI